MNLDDPEKSGLLLASDVQSDRLAVQEEAVNDGGEEYYPNSMFDIALPWQRAGHRVDPETGTSSSIFRSRGVRQVHAVGASTPSGSGTSIVTGTNTSQSSNNGGGSQSTGGDSSWYTLTAIILLYCLYIFWTS